jgi:Flp pilus assembly protein TadD
MAQNIANPPSAPSRLDRLWQYLSADPGNTSMLRDIAREGMSTGDFDQAIKALDGLRELRANDANDEAAAILSLLKLGQVQQAVERGLQAQAQWPEDEAVRVESSRALLNARRYDDVLVHTAGPFLNPTLAQMAGEFQLQALWHQGKVDEGSALAAGLVQQFPDNPRLGAQYSALLYDQERTKESLEAAHRAYLQSPQQAYAALHVLASERLMQGDVPGALRLVDEAQHVRKDDGRIWLLKGSALLMAGQIDEAVSDLKRALSIFPDHPGTHLTLAWVYIVRKELDEAEAVTHEAIAASPAFAESHGTLAVVYAMKGQSDDARQCIRRATLLDKTSFAARYAQAVLDGTPAGSIEEIFKDIALRVKL